MNWMTKITFNNIFFHGTLRSNLSEIRRTGGLHTNAGWGGAGTEGVYLSRTIEGALYWAKLAYLREIGAKLEPDRFDREYGAIQDELLVILRIEIPPEYIMNLKADMEQAEDYLFEGEESDWQSGLDLMGDVNYKGNIPIEWISIVS